MAWTTPRDWTAGEVVTEIMMDQQIKGNMEYLIATTQTNQTASRAINATTYQNTGNKLMFVAVTAAVTDGTEGYITASVSATSPASGSIVSAQAVSPGAGDNFAINIFFVVPPSWYYSVGSANATLSYWYEWT